MMKVLFFGERVTSESGFAWLNRHILKALHETGHEVHAAMWVYRGTQPIHYRPNMKLDGTGLVRGTKSILPYKIYPLTYEENYWGTNRVYEYINRIGPDVVLAHGDPQHLHYGGMNIIQICREAQIPLAAYVAIDGENHRDNVRADLEAIRWPVVYTHWARKSLEAEYPELKGHLRTIYPPVKPFTWHDDKDAIKKNPPVEFRDPQGEMINMKGKKIVLAVGRNTQRKGHVRLLRAMKKLKDQGRHDIVCIIHTNPRVSTTTSLDLIQFTKLWELEDRVFFTFSPDPARMKGLATDEGMNLLYAMADVHVMPSKREGFGLPLIEAAMAGTPSVGTNYASIAEILDDRRGYLVEPTDWEPCPEFNCIEALVSVPILKQAIKHVIDNPHEGCERARRLRAWAEDVCGGATIRRQWAALFRKIEQELLEAHK